MDAKSIVPRLSTKPVLSGADLFTVSFFREVLQDNGGAGTGFQSAQEVLSAARSDRFVNGGAGESVTHLIGWAQLWKNWSIATMIGDGQLANQYMSEAVKVESVISQGSANAVIDGFRLPGDTVSRIETSGKYMGLSIRLTYQARTIGDDSAFIPQVLDPEGYIRRRLEFVYDELIGRAQVIRSFAVVAPGPF